MGLTACSDYKCSCYCDMVCSVDGETVESFRYQTPEALKSCDEDEARDLCLGDFSLFPEFCTSGDKDCQRCGCL